MMRDPWKDGEPDIVEQLRHILAREPYYNLRMDAANEIVRLRALIQILLENDPNDLVADGGVTVLLAWRKEAEALLRKSVKKQQQTTNESL